MKKAILAGMSLCLPAAMLFAACGDTKATLKENISSAASPIASVAAQAEVTSTDIVSASSEDIASVVSEAVSSKATSSRKKASSAPSPSSKASTSSKQLTSSKEATSSKPVVLLDGSTFVPDPKNPEFLTASQKEQIKTAWINSYKELGVDRSDVDLEILYYGTYNGCIAFRAYDKKSAYPTWVWDMEVGGVTFHAVLDEGLSVYSNGKILSVQEAYDQGLLSQRDLKNFEYYFQMQRG